MFRDATVTSTNVGPSGSFVLAGYTGVDWSVGSSASREGVAVKFDAEGTPEWRWQVKRMAHASQKHQDHGSPTMSYYGASYGHRSTITLRFVLLASDSIRAIQLRVGMSGCSPTRIWLSTHFSD